MSDLENYYRGIDHTQLYNQLHEGNPKQVDALAARWQSFVDTADGLANQLAADLNKVAGGWDGSAGAEFQRRVGLVVTATRNVSVDGNNTKIYLSTSAGYLRNALESAEPAPNPNHARDDSMMGGAAGSLLGPVGTIVGGVIGNELGHQQDEEEKAKAHERIVKLVAGLANDYLMTQDTPPVDVLPDGLPGDGTTNTGPGDQGGSAVKAASFVSSAHASTRLSGSGTDTLKGVSAAPHLSGGGTSTPSGGTPSVSTPGVVGSVGGPTGTTSNKKRDDQEIGLLGAGAGAMTTAALGMSGGLAADAVRGASFGVAGAGSVPAGGAGGAFGGLAGASYGSEGIRSNGVISNQTNSAGAGGRGSNVLRADEASKSAAKGGKGGNSNMLGRGLGGSEEGDDQERTTWLTEDDRVWDDDRDIAPAVLGGRMVDSGREDEDE